jgi:antitoxin VapB
VSQLAEIYEKWNRIRSFLDEKGYDGMLIGRKDNFAWFSCGGSNEVIITAETGFGILLVTRDKVVLFAQVMDGQRIIDEELAGLEVVEGAVWDPTVVQSLHYPMTDSEVEKLRRLGKISEGVIRDVAERIEPGMQEIEIAGKLLAEYARLGIRCEVLLVGSDERISRYRHPNPSAKRVDRYALLAPAVSKWGLHADVSRMLHFGPVPEEIAKKYDAACIIEAASISLCRPGRKFAEILDVQKRLYKSTGYPEEWRYHYQGGVTGYVLTDPTLSQDPEAEVSSHQAYDWFITITGVKVEELSLNTGEHREVCSAAGRWPVKSYTYEDQSLDLPQILVRG